MRLPEEKKIVPVLYTANYGSGATFDSINMKGYHRATFIIGFGAIDGDAILYLYSGAADGEKTSALTFHYAFGGAARAAEDCDVLAADATSAALTLTGDSYDNYMLIVEIDADKMDTENAEEWLTGYIDTSGTTGIAFAFAILEPRYTGNQSITALE